MTKLHRKTCQAFDKYFWQLLCCLLISSSLQANQTQSQDQTHRFFMGVYYPSITNLVTRTDFHVAINFWLDEFGPSLGLKPIKAVLYDDITSLKQAFESHELDFIMAPPILLAKYLALPYFAE